MKDTEKGFEAQARRQARSLVDALAKTAQTEVDALRAAVEARTSALHKALSHADHAAALDQLVHDLSTTAKEEAEAAAARARSEVQQQAEAALKAARTETDKTREELEARITKAQAAAESTRGELEARLAKAQATAESAREETSKHLDRETKRANELAGTLETVRRESDAMKAEAEKLRQDLRQATERVRALEEARAKLEADRKAETRVEKPSEPAGVMLLERVGAALRAISGATTAAEMFEALIEPLGQHFTRAVVFQVTPSGFKGWIGRGFGTVDIGKVVVPRAIDALLKRGLAEKNPVAVTRGGDQAMPKGLTDSAIERAVVFPIIAGGKTFAVAYAEDAEGTAPAMSEVGRKIAEILIDQASRRLGTKQKASA